MTIQEFAENHRLKAGKDSCGEIIIRGKDGQIYEYSDTEFGVMFIPGLETRPGFLEGRGTGKWSPKRWNAFKRAAGAIGMTLRQNGDSEGALSFDPMNKQQVKVALKIAGARPKRQMSEKQLAHLATIGFKPSRLQVTT